MKRPVRVAVRGGDVEVGLARERAGDERVGDDLVGDLGLRGADEEEDWGVLRVVCVLLGEAARLEAGFADAVLLGEAARLAATFFAGAFDFFEVDERLLLEELRLDAPLLVERDFEALRRAGEAPPRRLGAISLACSLAAAAASATLVPGVF